MATAILRLPEVLRRTGLSRAEIYRLMGLGDFPQKIPLGVRVVGWADDEIQAWIDVRRGRRPSTSGKAAQSKPWGSADGRA